MGEMKLEKNEYKNIRDYILIVIISMGFGYLLARFDCNIIKLMRFLFLKNGEFQWLGITAIVGILSFVFTAVNNSKQIKADLVSKARIEWIKETKDMTSNIVSLAHIIGVKRSNYHISKKNNKEDDVTKHEIAIKKNELNKLDMDMRILLDKIQLNYSDTEEHEAIIKQIIEVREALKKQACLEETVHLKIVTNSIYIEVASLRDITKNYLKKEWDKAKSGK